MKNWKQQQILDESELDKYQDDAKSEKKYLTKFMWVRLTVLPLFVAFLYVAFTSNNELIIVTIFAVMMFFAILSIIVQRNTKASCYRCNNTMLRHEYTNHKPEYSKGIVYICKACNTKFIYQYPDNSNI